jgi:hypothetical protein
MTMYEPSSCCPISQIDAPRESSKVNPIPHSYSNMALRRTDPRDIAQEASIGGVKGLAFGHSRSATSDSSMLDHVSSTREQEDPRKQVGDQ